MIWVDTHTHPYDARFDEDRAEAIRRAGENGVTRMLLPAIDSQTHGAMLALAEAFPQTCFPMIGVHPTSVNDNPGFRQELETVERYLRDGGSRFYGIGETGLDLYWSRDFLREQEEALRFQIELALRYDLPVVLHTREAFDAIIGVFESYRSRGVRGVFHSFCGTPEHYRKIKKLGDFRFGIGGPVTYKKSRMAATVSEMELSDIVLETDSPYLPPVPFRGKRNQSAYLPYIGAKVAELLQIDVARVAETTTRNAVALFGLPEANDL